MSAGKLASQVGHAVQTAVTECPADMRKAWERDDSRIVVLQVEDRPALERVAAAARRAKLQCCAEHDAGLTEVADGEWTVFGVGPDLAARIDPVTGALELYRSKEEDEVIELRKRLRDVESELAAFRSGGSGGIVAASVGLPEPFLQSGVAWMFLDLSASRPPRIAEIPELYEQWCWEGDPRVLPRKWENGLTSCCEGTALPSASRPWESSTFDKEGIFFLTDRSDTVGIAMAFVCEGAAVLGALGVHPSYRRKGVGRCLLRLCAHRQLELGRTRMWCKVPAGRSGAAARALLLSEGFREGTGSPVTATVPLLQVSPRRR